MEHLWEATGRCKWLEMETTACRCALCQAFLAPEEVGSLPALKQKGYYQLLGEKTNSQRYRKVC